jgi:hypothetical protein
LLPEIKAKIGDPQRQVIVSDDGGNQTRTTVESQ